MIDGFLIDLPRISLPLRVTDTSMSVKETLMSTSKGEKSDWVLMLPSLTDSGTENFSSKAVYHKP
jgi:hypothetical protein